MKSLVPVPRDDELVWSVVSRYCALFPHRASRAVAREAFLRCDNEIRRVTIDFPARLNEIAQSFAESLGITGAELAIRHTMLPFVAPYSEYGDSSNLVNSMCEKGIAGYSAGRWAWALGMETSTPLRFCPLCRRDDVAKWGSAHWRRLHQVSELTNCAVHVDVALENSQVTRSNREYVSLDSVPSVEPRESKPDPMQIVLMRELIALLDGPMPWVGRERMRATLLTAAGRKMGYLPTKLGIEKWAASIVAFFGSEALARAKMELHDPRTGWLWGILSSKEKILPVTSVIAVSAWAGATLCEMNKMALSRLEEEKGPWPCMNNRASCFGKMTIKHWRRATDDISHRFACPECGTSYVRPHPLTVNGDGAFEFRIVREPGLWASGLETEWMKPEHSLLSLARLYRKTSTTIALRAARLGLPDVGQRKLDRYRRIKGHEMAAKRAAHREQWLEILRNHSALPLHALPKRLGRVGKWLLSNDREWYKGHTPIAYRPRGRAKDWQRLDIAAETHLLEMDGELRAMRVNRTTRVSLSTILEAVRRRADIKRHALGRMPRTLALMERLTESPRAFARRRIVEVVRGKSEPVRWRSTLAREANAADAYKRDSVVRKWVDHAFEFLKFSPVAEYATFSLADGPIGYPPR